MPLKGSQVFRTGASVGRVTRVLVDAHGVPLVIEVEGTVDGRFFAPARGMVVEGGAVHLQPASPALGVREVAFYEDRGGRWAADPGHAPPPPASPGVRGLSRREPSA